MLLSGCIHCSPNYHFLNSFFQNFVNLSKQTKNNFITETFDMDSTFISQARSMYLYMLFPSFIFLLSSTRTANPLITRFFFLQNQQLVFYIRDEKVTGTITYKNIYSLLYLLWNVETVEGVCVCVCERKRVCENEREGEIEIERGLLWKHFVKQTYSELCFFGLLSWEANTGTTVRGRRPRRLVYSADCRPRRTL